MKKVITINLNGHAYQVEEGGYDALRAYLDRAAEALADNPDRAEIMADLERAIADRCRAHLGPHKSVVTDAEVERIVDEMGPVDGAPGTAAGDGAEAGAKRSKTSGASAAPKRLYRITDNAMVGGVCQGLAAYFAIDVTLVRIGFAITTLVTEGFGILAYVVMMIVIPEAKTSEERAAAGAPAASARDLVDRARKEAKRTARRAQASWRRQQRAWNRYGYSVGMSQPASPAAAGIAAMFTFVHFALMFAAIAAAVAIVNHGEVFGWELDPDVPVWAAVLVLLVAYQVIVAPIRAAAGSPFAGSGPAHVWNAAIWLVGFAFVWWYAVNHQGEVREFITRAPDVLRDFFDSVRDWISR